MKILVGWFCLDTGELVDIPGFDAVQDPERWIMALADVPDEEVKAKFGVPDWAMPVDINKESHD